jgi:DNA polymerase elongation subunit (family B)
MSENKNKKRFYTSVESKGSNILLRGYEDGKPFDHKIKYQPYLFVPDPNGDWKSFEGKTSRPVSKKIFESMPVCRDYIKEYGSISNARLFGTDNFVRQFISSNFKGKIDWDFDTIQSKLIDIETEVIDGFPDVNEAKERILLITVADRQKIDGRHKVICWSWQNAKRDAYMDGIDEKKYDVELRVFESEKHMLVDFLQWWKGTRIDVFGGWNSETFDVPYLVNRILRELGETATAYLSPWRSFYPKSVIKNNKEYITYEIAGITHLDLLDLYKKFNPGSQEEWNLNYIASEELGHGKTENPYESFSDFYTLAWDKFVNYNIVDTILLIELDEKKKMLSQAMAMAYMAKCSYGDILSAMRLWESMIHNYFEDQQIAEVLGKQKNSRKDIVGAYVHEPRPGRRRWVVSVDATSMYPSIMMQNNLSPECIVDMIDMSVDMMLAGKFSVPEGMCLSGNGLLTTTAVKGFIPTLVGQVFNTRKDTKNQMLEIEKRIELEAESLSDQIIEMMKADVSALDMAQGAYKIAINSFYGITALPYFKYYDARIAEAVTSTGQVFLKSAMKFLNEIINKIMQTKDVKYAFYGDTDSIYFEMDAFVDKYCAGLDDQAIVSKIEKFVQKVLQPELNKRLASVAESIGAKECKIFFKLECIGPTMVMTGKKKYFFDILYKEGVRYEKPKMKVMGIEVVRSSTPGAIKDYLKKSLEIILRGTEREIQQHIKHVHKEFLSKTFKEVACPVGINGLDTYGDKHTIYSKGTPMQVRGALLYNHHLHQRGLDKKYPVIGEGEKVKYIMLKLPNTIHENVIAFPGNLPKELGLEKYFDVKTQYQKVFLTPVARILDAVGWSAEERINLEEFMA